MSELNILTDRLNELLIEYEQNLVDRKIGVQAFIELDPSTNSRLGFMKYSNRWGLYVTSGVTEPNRITSCSREKRLLAAALILNGALEAELLKVEQAHIATLRDTVDRFETFVQKRRTGA